MNTQSRHADLLRCLKCDFAVLEGMMDEGSESDFAQRITSEISYSKKQCFAFLFLFFGKFQSLILLCYCQCKISPVTDEG
jgi:hypothetical protein